MVEVMYRVLLAESLQEYEHRFTTTVEDKHSFEK
jgi:hypothetical protein